MKKTTAIRFLCALLAVLMLPLAGCGTDTPSEETGGDTAQSDVTAAVTEETSAETNRADAKDNLPADLNLNGEVIHILTRDATQVLDFDVMGTDNSGDIVHDAVWNRNTAVESRLNADMDVMIAPAASLYNHKQFIQQTLLAAAGDFDLIITTNNAIVLFGMVGYLLTFNDAPYLDFDAPWWWTDSMKDLALDGKTIQYLIGDMLLSNILTTGAVFANKEIWTDNFGDPDQLYQMVLDGTWTLDKFAEYSKDVYKDVNGDGVMDDKDIVGFYGNEYQTVDFFAGGAEVFFTERGDDGYVRLKAPDEKAASLAEDLINLFYNDKAAMIAAGSDEKAILPAFTEGRSLFMVNTLLSTTRAEMRDMKADYAIVPVPKYDADQKNYSSLIYDNSTNAAAPITVDDDKFASLCAVLEALSAESYRSVTENLYEVALKMKYTRDSKSAQMLDIITETACKNFAADYDSRLASIRKVLQTSVAAKNMMVVSVYETVAPQAKAGIAELIAELEKING